MRAGGTSRNHKPLVETRLAASQGVYQRMRRGGGEGDAASRVSTIVSHPCLRGFRFTAFAEPFDQQIEHRDEEQVQDGAHDHTAEYRRADGMTSVFAGAAGCHERYNAQNEGE